MGDFNADDFSTDDFVSMGTEITLDEQLIRLPNKKKKKKINQNTSKYMISYDHVTSFYYVALRNSRSDPITNELFKKDDPKAFKFKYMWDPMTGTRLEEDPNGPYILILYHL